MQMDTPGESPESAGAPPEAPPDRYPRYATFAEMDLSPEVRRALIEELKYATPTDVQAEAFAPIRAGRDVVVQSRTGTGKTAAFGIPLADRIDPATRATQLLVLAPTRELANQVGTELERINRFRGSRVASIYGGAAFGPQLDALKAGAQIVSGTPGRVLDHLRRRTLKLDGLRCFVLDEADEMLSMGFQDELEAILEYVPTPRQTLLLSATFPPEIRRMIDKSLVRPIEVMLSSGNISVDKITHYYYVTSHMRKPQTLLTLLESEEPDAAIVFANTREDANFVGTFLQNRGFDAEVLTGELTQAQRERVMAKIKGGMLRYLVATDVAARGIDIADLSHVINYNLPTEAEIYVHRTGRTGRAGKSGTAVSIVSGLDISTLYALTRWMKINVEERPIPTEPEIRNIKLDRRAKRLANEARGRIEEGSFAPGTESEATLLLAEKVLAQPHAREIVAMLLERVAKPGEATAAGPRAPTAAHAAAEMVAAGVTEVMASVEAPAGGAPVRARIPAPPRESERPARDADRPPREGDRSSRGEDRTRRDGPRARPDRNRDRGGRRDEERARPSPSASSTTLIVTLGRRHGVSARDVGLFVVETAGIDVNSVRDVRVRDGYSFLDVDPAKAERIVQSVNGKERQGRSVKVELARARPGTAGREGPSDATEIEVETAKPPAPSDGEVR